MQIACLSETTIVARRIAFVMAKAASTLGLPIGCSVDVLPQSAMEHPEKITPGEYSLFYALRTPGALQ